MTRYTALRIQNDSKVYGTAYGPVNGKYGVYIGTWDESPSGSPRPMVLLTSEALYETADEAAQVAKQYIKEVRETPTPE